MDQNSQEMEKYHGRKRFPIKKVGKTGAILYTVFGSILSVGFGIPVFVCSLLGSPSSLLIGLGAPATAGLAMGVAAARNFRRLGRFNRYLHLMERSDFCFLDELAEYSGRSKRFVLKDLQRMLQKGFLPHAHITQDRSMIILTKECYERYIFEQRQRKFLGDALMEGQKVELIEETSSTIQEGRDFITKVRAALGAIQDQDVKNQIHRIENIVSQIFRHIEKHPEQAGNLRRFNEYYLPATLKLLNVFNELELHSVSGSNIATTKEEIKNSLELIHKGFEALFNNLFAGISIDVSSDIAVLNSLMASDGLAGDGIL